MKKGRVSVNLITSIVAFGVNIVVSFFLTPYVIEKLGNEAYGFIGMANTFISYLTIVTIALNAYASRFICISYFQGDKNNSNKYYSSVLFSNTLIIFIIAIFLPILIWSLPFLFKISPSLVVDVKLLFFFVFINYFVTLFGVAFSVGTIINNRLDIEAKKNTMLTILKALLIVAGFNLIGIHAWIVGAASLMCAVIGLLILMIYQLISVTSLRFSIKNISISHVADVVKSGMWSSIGTIGNVLNSGLDLWVTNRFLNAVAMGEIALMSMLTNMYIGFTGTIHTVFWPKMLKSYSENDNEVLVKNSINAIRTQGVFAALSLAGFIAVGKEFLNLWVPTQRNEELYRIIVIGLIACSMSAISRPMSAVFGLVNKLKVNALINIFVGFANFISMLFLIHFTGLGVYGVAITSAVPIIIYSLTYIPICSAKYIRIRVSIWYKEIIRFIIFAAWLIVIFSVIGMLFLANTWLRLLGKILVLVIAGGVIIIFAYIGKAQKNQIIRKVKIRLFRC